MGEQQMIVSTEELRDVGEHGREVPPTAAVLQLLFGKHVSYGVSAIARLGVADCLGDGPLWVDQIASKVGAHPPSLYRVMRMLASVGMFEELSDKRFKLTPLGETLRSDSSDSLRYTAMQWGDEWSTRSFEHFTDSVRTGEDGVTKAYGKHVFAVLADHPHQGETFNRSMANFSAIAARAIVESYSFSDVNRMADVGGGQGMLLASILRANPHLHGVLYDLPEVTAGAQAAGHLGDVRQRVEIESGSFFDRVPEGCDAYLLKHIIHDWSDDHCRRILSLIRAQLPPNGRVLLCELLIGDDAGPSPAKMLDIEMLLMTVGGRERTTEEFRELLLSAGLRLERIITTASPVCILEARAVTV
jgi:O-methyltransferase domain